MRGVLRAPAVSTRECHASKALVNACVSVTSRIGMRRSALEVTANAPSKIKENGQAANAPLKGDILGLETAGTGGGAVTASGCIYNDLERTDDTVSH